MKRQFAHLACFIALTLGIFYASVSYGSSPGDQDEETRLTRSLNTSVQHTETADAPCWKRALRYRPVRWIISALVTGGSISFFWLNYNDFKIGPPNFINTTQIPQFQHGKFFVEYIPNDTSYSEIPSKHIESRNCYQYPQKQTAPDYDNTSAWEQIFWHIYNQTKCNLTLMIKPIYEAGLAEDDESVTGCTIGENGAVCCDTALAKPANNLLYITNATCLMAKRQQNWLTLNIVSGIGGFGVSAVSWYWAFYDAVSLN